MDGEQDSWVGSRIDGRGRRRWAGDGLMGQEIHLCFEAKRQG